MEVEGSSDREILREYCRRPQTTDCFYRLKVALGLVLGFDFRFGCWLPLQKHL